MPIPTLMEITNLWDRNDQSLFLGSWYAIDFQSSARMDASMPVVVVESALNNSNAMLSVSVALLFFSFLTAALISAIDDGCMLIYDDSG